jgi:DNA helicase-2/ATP-dependent DNA helicase PcrA
MQHPSRVTNRSNADAEHADAELERIVGEEEQCLERVRNHLRDRASRREVRTYVDYDGQMLALRDEIAAARLEDVPPLLEQMGRLQSLAARQREVSEGHVDQRSPYFGRMVLEEGERRREVLLGRTTYLDTGAGVRIVDWRDAPVSRLYYRYDEDSEYDEVFGDREVNGRILTRRSVTITEGELRRITAPQGTFARSRSGVWRRLDGDAARLHGGQGSAIRAEQHHRPGRLGVGEDLTDSESKQLREITPLIDARQFELITQPDSGLVVIQGGAGSGKTTIGLHRLAYLAYQDPRRFRADRMLVVVFNAALARYISQVLPALGVQGVAIRPYEDWAARLRAVHFPRLPRPYHDETPGVVTRLKKHPAMLRCIDDHVAELESSLGARIAAAAEGHDGADGALRNWNATTDRPLAHRVHALTRWLRERSAREFDTDTRVRLERLAAEGMRTARDVSGAWADLLTDSKRLAAALERHAPGAFSDAELRRAHAWCSARCSDALTEAEERAETVESSTVARGARRADPHPATREADDDILDGVDGSSIADHVALDREDDALLLRLYQKLVGPLRRGGAGKEALVYEHVLIDEAQDLSPVELDVVLGTISKAQSVTLAGDVAQRLHLDNGFSDWNTVLSDLGLSHVAVEPLRLSYRSTKPIIDFSHAVLGHLAPKDAPLPTRDGIPVEAFQFSHSGDAAAFMAESLRGLMQSEPRASVAVIARYPEQADLYSDALNKGEVPYLRRIADQDFPFRPGVDVTDVRQVKGLEFDYVVLVDVNDASYPADDEARHLLHIGATRAAHQLWVLTGERPSTLLPESLVDKTY